MNLGSSGFADLVPQLAGHPLDANHGQIGILSHSEELSYEGRISEGANVAPDSLRAQRNGLAGMQSAELILGDD